MERKEIELIADEAIATFISMLHPKGTVSAGLRGALDKFHESAIEITADHIERKQRIAADKYRLPKHELDALYR